jgi:hypothetical protein
MLRAAWEKPRLSGSSTGSSRKDECESQNQLVQSLNCKQMSCHQRRQKASNGANRAMQQCCNAQLPVSKAAPSSWPDDSHCCTASAVRAARIPENGRRGAPTRLMIRQFLFYFRVLFSTVWIKTIQNGAQHQRSYQTTQ